MNQQVPDAKNHEALQVRLQHRFADAALLSLALTHRSFGSPHNERLEFLGDSVLNLAVSGMLYQALQHQPEGDLSRVRAGRDPDPQILGGDVVVVGFSQAKSIYRDVLLAAPLFNVFTRF